MLEVDAYPDGRTRVSAQRVSDSGRLTGASTTPFLALCHYYINESERL
jgi:hypothetical protein